MTSGRTPAIIVDIDGTVALRGTRGPFDWARVGEDTPNRVVIDVIEAWSLTHPDHTIIVVSGRSDKCFLATGLWLQHHLFDRLNQSRTRAGHPPLAEELHMRPEGDYRPDTDIKAEIYIDKIQRHYEVHFVLDDRNSVVKLWRDLGLTCLQVAPGNF